MLESAIQTKIKKWLEARGWIVVKCITMSKNGWPDLQAHRFSQTIFVETKQAGKQPTPLQHYMHQLLRKEGFTVVIAHELKDVEFMK